jgi:oxygen-independent coproporphyrinogen-3 oxidase
LGDDPVNGRNSGTIAHYVEILCQEIKQTIPSGDSLKTLFFGGGTPSLLSVPQLAQILTTLDQCFGIDPDAEISMEVDPGTFDHAQLQGYRAAGVNRISLGVQAFQPELLAVCGRSHTVEEIDQAIGLIQQIGFTNISLDLISGLPHQTLAHWQESLERAIALAPTHLSCYDLIVEPMTAFGRQYKPGVSPLPSDETAADFYRAAQRLLTAAGYEHYEISNYAKPGYQCHHNRVYWQNQPFYGFGMGATSYLEGDRFARPRKTGEYYAWVERMRNGVGIRGQGVEGKGEGESAGLEGDISECDRLLETLMLGLRMAEGLAIEPLIAQFGIETIKRIWKRLKPYIKNNWVTIIAPPMSHSKLESSTTLESINQIFLEAIPETGRIRLTDPEGFLFSNVVLTTLFEEFEVSA